MRTQEYKYTHFLLANLVMLFYVDKVVEKTLVLIISGKEGKSKRCGSVDGLWNITMCSALNKDKNVDMEREEGERDVWKAWQKLFVVDNLINI